MIKITATTNGGENEIGVGVIFHGDEKSLIKEMFAILKAIDEKHPKILMNAVDLHIKDICDEIMKEGGDHD